MILALIAVALTITKAVILGREEATLTFRIDATIWDGTETAQSSAIWEMKQKKQLGLGELLLETNVRGEALRFVLGDGRTLYLLKRAADSLSSLGFAPFPNACRPAMYSHDEKHAYLDSFTGPCNGLESAMPMIVRFDNDADPSSFHVEPFQPAGPDCVSKCLSLSVVRADGTVSTGIDQFLPWLKLGSIGARIGTGEDKGSVISGPPRYLYNLDFSTEIAR